MLQLVESGSLKLLSSAALEFEIGRMPDAERQFRAREMLTLADETLEMVDGVQNLAAEFVRRGVKPLDALHLAFATVAGADFFCTCDDKLLKKAKRLKTNGTTVVEPLELIARVRP